MTEIVATKTDIADVTVELADVRSDIARQGVRTDALVLRFATLGVSLVGVAIAAIKPL